ncbi:hypothetical protein QQ056_08015 [Oscillatoria laete-virens NRMC-F 0139]|nr:hypothetical protein [Oscillatoria laete-virens NRMC-F 0139]
MKKQQPHPLEKVLSLKSTSLEIRCPRKVESRKIDLTQKTQVVASQGLKLTVKTVWKPRMKEFSGPCAEVSIQIGNVSAKPVSYNLKWTLPFADQNTLPRWMMPALFYKKKPADFRRMAAFH